MLRKMVVCFLCVILFVVAGCGKEPEPDEPVSFETVTFNQVLNAMEKQFKDKIDVNYNKDFEKTLLNKQFEQKGHGGSSKVRDGYVCGYNVLYTGKLIEDEGIKSIKYTLSNCIGTFLGENDEHKDNDIMDSIENLESVPYVLEGSDQSNVAFRVYYGFDNELGNKEQCLAERECIKYLRITAEVTYEDGSTKTYMYGVDYKYEKSVSYKAIQIYQLD